jgi:hypothetical protein
MTDSDRWMRRAAVGLALLSALAMADAARYGWGGATIEGDRVKWGLRSMGRSPLQPVLVVKDFCRWRDGARGLCAVEPGAAWAAGVFRWAQPAAWMMVVGYLASAALLTWRPSAGGRALLGTGLATALLGVAAIGASRQISIYIRHGVDPGQGGSLTWRAALVLTLIALVLASRARAGTG